MARIDTPADPFTELAFELERFEWTAADRLEVTGRWYGVRGRRFVRPTLHLRVDGRRRRLIAVLDHKPWAADTEDLWTAAFAWKGAQQGVTDARLEVSTDVVLDLPAPGSGTPAQPLTPRPRPKPEPRRVEPTPEAAPPAASAAPPARKRRPRAKPSDELSPAAASAQPKPRAKRKPPAVTAPQADAAPARPKPRAGAAPRDAAAAPAKTPPEATPRAAEAAPPAAAPLDETPSSEEVPRAPRVASPPLAAPPAASTQVHGSSGDAPETPRAMAPPAPPPHAQTAVAAEIAVLALERRLVEERAEREALARELEAARRQIEGLSSHHDSAIERAEELVELEGRLAVANARADAAVAHVTRLERELAEQQVAAENARPIEVKPLPPRTARRRRTEEWDARTRIAAVVVIVVAFVVLLTIVLTLL